MVGEPEGTGARKKAGAGDSWVATAGGETGVGAESGLAGGKGGREAVSCEVNMDHEGLVGELTRDGPAVRGPLGVPSTCARRVAAARRAAARRAPVIVVACTPLVAEDDADAFLDIGGAARGVTTLLEAGGPRAASDGRAGAAVGVGGAKSARRLVEEEVESLAEDVGRIAWLPACEEAADEGRD